MADNLKQALQNKARLDKFILSFTVPQCLQSIESKTERATEHKSRTRVLPDKLQYSVYGVVVPEISVPSIELPYSGQHMKASGHARDAYEDVTINFNVDNQFNNYWYIWRWLDILNDSEVSTYDALGHGKSNPQLMGSRNEDDPELMMDYQTDFTLYGINEYNKRQIEFTYTKAFPNSLGGIEYNYQSSDEIASSFTFSFSQLLVKLL